MNKEHLVAEVGARLDVSRRAATEAVDAVVATIMRAVAAGETVTIPGFGTFEPRMRAPRIARNPATGERVAVPASPCRCSVRGPRSGRRSLGRRDRSGGGAPRRSGERRVVVDVQGETRTVEDVRAQAGGSRTRSVREGRGRSERAADALAHQQRVRASVPGPGDDDVAIDGQERLDVVGRDARQVGVHDEDGCPRAPDGVVQRGVESRRGVRPDLAARCPAADAATGRRRAARSRRAPKRRARTSSVRAHAAPAAGEDVRQPPLDGGSGADGHDRRGSR